MPSFRSIFGTNIGLGLSGEAPERLRPNPEADQRAPKRFYVYGHITPEGTYFYIGKGTGKRAWDDDRHPLWRRYVRTHLNGQYAVRILADDLTSEEAENLENLWVAQESATLVNWINFGRSYDSAALDRLNKLRDENRERYLTAKGLEASAPEDAIKLYILALKVVDEYSGIDYETGLVGQLLREERDEVGRSGDLAILDRLTMCVVKLGRYDEAQAALDDYLLAFRADRERDKVAKILKRLQKRKPPKKHEGA